MSDPCDLSVTCPCEVWSVPDKSVTRVLSVARMKGSVDLTVPTGGECVGATLTVEKVGPVCPVSWI